YASRIRIASRAFLPAVAGLCTVLTIAGWFLVPPAADPLISFYNRVIGIVLLWALALMLIRAAWIDEQLRMMLEAQARLAAIVETSDDAIVSKSLDGIVATWNRSAEVMFGYRADEIVGTSILRIIPPDRAHEEAHILQRIKRGERIEHFETIRRRKDGTEFPVSLTISPIKDVRGNLIGASKIARDITDKKWAEETLRRQTSQLQEQAANLSAANERLVKQSAALEAANKELEGFSYSVSHDLRAPIRTIHSFVRIIEEDHSGRLDPELARCLGIIAKAAKQAGELIDDLLEFSRLGRQALQQGQVDMVGLVREVLDELRKEDGAPGVTATVADLPACFGDRRLLKLAWMNLLSNALKYSRYREHPTIEVGWRASEKPEELCIYYVKDNGVGFDMRYAHKLFGVFQRLHGKEEFEGTGVGLAIVQRIIHRHGGQVWGEGEVDRGATFYFTLERSASS
ncbi:MAG TPA: PAS domain S-box protein, partial [Nitrospiraceae bacterium]|nr:PAS domain S-box protein [Nitrospiraceae bacterium]